MSKYIKIFSHPRSGTHFLEAFLAKNFYEGVNLSSDGPIYYGHWSNKILLESGEPYHKLFGSHFFPDESKQFSKMIYIYRDGRSVIASIWNSKFYNKEWEGISFSEFLRKEIDWHGGLGQKKYNQMNIVQHWFNHTNAWNKVSSPDLMLVRFEDLKNNPHEIYSQICRKFFPLKYISDKVFKRKLIDPISNKVGLAPNSANISGWKTLFNDNDLDFFYRQLPNKKFLYNH